MARSSKGNNMNPLSNVTPEARALPHAPLSEKDIEALERLQHLRGAGILSDQEFDEGKRLILARKSGVDKERLNSGESAVKPVVKGREKKAAMVQGSRWSEEESVQEDEIFPDKQQSEGRPLKARLYLMALAVFLVGFAFILFVGYSDRFDVALPSFLRLVKDYNFMFLIGWNFIAFVGFQLFQGAQTAE